MTKMCFNRAALNIGGGGLGTDVVYYQRALTTMIVGKRSLPNYHSLALDYLSDLRPPPGDMFPEIPAEIWSPLRPQELAGLGDGQPFSIERVRVVRENPERFGWLSVYLPESCLEQVVGAEESSGLPAFTAWTMGMETIEPREDGLPCWLDMIRNALDNLRPEKLARKLVMEGLPPDSARKPILVRIFGGAAGGTFSGSCAFLAAVVRDHARRSGIPVEIEVHCAVGLYRSDKDVAQRMKKLARSCHFVKELEQAQASRVWSFPVARGEVRHEGALADRLLWYEASGSFLEDYAAMVRTMGEALVTKTFSRREYEVGRNEANL